MKCVKLVEKKEFVAIIIDLEYETILVHVALLGSILLTNANVYLFCKP